MHKSHRNSSPLKTSMPQKVFKMPAFGSNAKHEPLSRRLDDSAHYFCRNTRTGTCYSVLHVINIAGLCYVNSIFNVAPKEKVERRKVRRSWWPKHRSCAPNPLLWKTSVQRVLRPGRKMWWCSIVLKLYLAQVIQRKTADKVINDNT